MARAQYLLKFSERGANDNVFNYIVQQIRSEGLDIDTRCTDTNSRENSVRIAVVSAKSFDALFRQAERLKIIRPLKQSEEVIEFTRTKKDQLQPSEGKYLFTAAEEVWLLHHALQSVPHEQHKLCLRKQGKCEGFLTCLLSSKVAALDEAFPLHQPNGKTEVSSVLWQSLVPWKKIDTQKIRNYFGEEVGFYFTWMKFYSSFVFWPAVLGILMFLFRPSNATVDTDAYLPFYSMFMALWGVLFLVYWERAAATKSFQWNTYKFSIADEQRPEFDGVLRKDPVTLQPALYYPSWKRRLWYVFSIVTMLPLLSVGVLAMTLSLNLNGYVKDKHSPIYVGYLASFAEPGGLFAPDSPYFGWLIPTVLHSIIIASINWLYGIIAEKCTELENHRTIQSSHSSLVVKRVSFECFDCFMPLFYIAFYQLDVVTLRAEIVSLFMSDEIRRILLESLLPLIKYFTTKSIQNKKQKSAKMFTLLPKDMALAEYDVFDDYLEMVIQFGYITLFASVFSLGPLVTLVFLFLEIRSDLFKLVHAYKRPVPRRVKDIGVWLDVMKAMVFVSILTNCAILGFASEQMMQWLPTLFTRRVSDGDQTMAMGSGRYVVGLVFGAEHLILLAALFLQWAIAPVPKRVRIAIARREFLIQTRMAREAQTATTTTWTQSRKKEHKTD